MAEVAEVAVVPVGAGMDMKAAGPVERNAPAEEAGEEEEEEEEDGEEEDEDDVFPVTTIANPMRHSSLELDTSAVTSDESNDAALEQDHPSRRRSTLARATTASPRAGLSIEHIPKERRQWLHIYRRVGIVIVIVELCAVAWCLFGVVMNMNPDLFADAVTGTRAWNGSAMMVGCSPAATDEGVGCAQPFDGWNLQSSVGIDSTNSPWLVLHTLLLLVVALFFACHSMYLIFGLQNAIRGELAWLNQRGQPIPATTKTAAAAITRSLPWLCRAFDRFDLLFGWHGKFVPYFTGGDKGQWKLLILSALFPKMSL